MEILSSVPDAVWAAIMASLLTLGGVGLTNRHFAKRQQQQLAHEKEQSAIAREFDLRRSVYLDAAEEITLALQHLSNIAHIDTAKENVSEPLRGFFISTNKACLVASTETVAVLNNFLIEFSQAFFELLEKMTPIQDARTTRDIQNTAYDKYQAEVARLLAASAQFNEEAKTDSTVWNALSTNLQFNMDRSSEAADAGQQAWAELNRLTSVYAIESLPILRRLGQLAVPVFVEIRTELGLISDIGSFEKSFDERSRAMSEHLERFIHTIGEDAA